MRTVFGFSDEIMSSRKVIEYLTLDFQCGYLHHHCTNPAMDAYIEMRVREVGIPLDYFITWLTLDGAGGYEFVNGIEYRNGSIKQYINDNLINIYNKSLIRLDPMYKPNFNTISQIKKNRSSELWTELPKSI